MLKRLYDKSKIWFAITWIIAYCVLMSVGDYFSVLIGVEKSITLAISLGLSIILVWFLTKHKLLKEHGICKSDVKAKNMLFYIPILIMLTANLWYGLTLNYGVIETIFYVLTMLFVGLLEEIIFRGLLFNGMKQDSLKAAIIVSSITFGMGHIINLFNGSGMQLISNLLQVVYATAAGFMFVMIYYKSGSLLLCIASHGLFNALSAFSNEANATIEVQMISAILLAIITGGYALYLAMSLKKNKEV
jgi:membrane protease YdiL (CAAX protease family)